MQRPLVRFLVAGEKKCNRPKLLCCSFSIAKTEFMNLEKRDLLSSQLGRFKGTVLLSAQLSSVRTPIVLALQMAPETVTMQQAESQQCGEASPAFGDRLSCGN